MIDLRLQEFETITAPLTSGQARQLQATACVEVTPDARAGHWQISAFQQVGALVVDDVRLLVRPKIPLENLFLLLGAGLPAVKWRRETFPFGADADLLPSVIAFFARTVETTLGRGLFRHYRERHDWLVALRGRVDARAQIARAGMAPPLACHFDEFTADVAVNRYLKAAVRLAARVPEVPAVDRRRLLQQLVDLEEVSDAPVVPNDGDRLIRNLTRLNAHYEEALGLARLILTRLTLVDRLGAATASSFMIDMNDLFQRFVTARLQRALAGRLTVHAERGEPLALGHRVWMAPDLTFTRRGAVVGVADVKYKLTTGAGRAPDYYQLFAYVTALDLPEGVLIYCRDEGGRAHDAVTVRHVGKVLHTRALDLGGDPESVAAEMDRLADWIAGRARSAAADKLSAA